MPTVPGYGQRQQISDLPTVRSNLNLTPDAFGAQIGRAGQGLAAQVSEYAVREQEKQDTAALMNAERELQSWQNQALFAPQTGAFAQRGQNAFDVPDKLMPEWDKRVGEVEGRLTDRQREVFRQRAGGMRVSMERDLMRHVGSEAEAFQKTETAALVDTRMETAMLYWQDPGRFDQELREAQGVFLAGNDGLPPAALAAGMREIESKGRSGVVGKMIEQNPLEAQRYFDTWADKMTEADRAQAERVLRPAWVDAEGRKRLDAIKLGGRAGAPVVAKTEAAASVKSAAEELGIDPVDLATVISYETAGTFSPDQAGPTTKWGQHKGLIQFGEPQRAKYGVRDGMTVAEQMPAVVRYLKDHGVKPGMGIMDVYSAINAGAPGRYNASDAANGGAPGTVADKVNNQMGAHRKKAEAMFERLQAGAVASPESAAAAIAPPATKAETLARINEEPNPQLRASMLNAYKMELNVEEVREAEIEQANVESINTKVEAANPAANLRDVLTPQEFAWAAEQGKLPAWEQRMAQRLNGTEPKTDPVVFDALQTMLARAENGDATAIAEVKKLDPTALFTKLDKQARDYVQNRRLGIVGADKKKGDDAPDFATEDDLLNVEVFDKLGISKNVQKDDSEETKSTRVEFMQSYWATVEQRQAEKGKKLTAGEKQAIMKELLLPFARKVQDSFLYFDSTEEKRAFEIGNVPSVDRQQIVDAFKRVHGVQPTDAQVRAAYLRGQGYTPKLEAE